MADYEPTSFSINDPLQVIKAVRGLYENEDNFLEEVDICSVYVMENDVQLFVCFQYKQEKQIKMLRMFPKEKLFVRNSLNEKTEHSVEGKLGSLLRGKFGLFTSSRENLPCPVVCSPAYRCNGVSGDREFLGFKFSETANYAYLLNEKDVREPTGGLTLQECKEISKFVFK